MRVLDQERNREFPDIVKRDGKTFYKVGVWEKPSEAEHAAAVIELKQGRKYRIFPKEVKATGARRMQTVYGVYIGGKRG